MTRRVGLDNTDDCPLGHRCECCGTACEKLTVTTATTSHGVLCLTTCPRCARSTHTPPGAVSTAARLVGQHCQHLGITLDEMAAAMEAGR